MIKCGNCDALCEDNAVFCGACGARIEHSETCPACGSPLMENACYCAMCGSKLARTEYKVCPACGEKLDKSMHFCHNCGGALDDVKCTAEISLDKSGGNKKHGKLKSASTKAHRSGGAAARFPGRVPLIQNIIAIAVCIMVVLFGLLMPVKIMGYQQTSLVPIKGMDNDTDVSFDYTAQMIEVKQSVWKIFAACKYVGLDPDDDKDTVELLDDRFDDICEAAYASAYRKMGVSENTSVSKLDRELFMKIYKETLEEKLADFDYFGYIIATDLPLVDKNGKEPFLCPAIPGFTRLMFFRS